MSSSEKRKLPVVILWPSFSPDLFRHESISEFRNLNFHKTIELILTRDRFVELLWFWTCSLTLQPTRTTNDEIASRSPQDIDVPTVLDFQMRLMLCIPYEKRTSAMTLGTGTSSSKYPGRREEPWLQVITECQNRSWNILTSKSFSFWSSFPFIQSFLCTSYKSFHTFWNTCKLNVVPTFFLHGSKFLIEKDKLFRCISHSRIFRTNDI